jgi:hypothetical protein
MKQSEVLKDAQQKPLGLGEELVLVNDRCDRNFAVWIALIHPHYSAFASHAYAFRQSDFWGESKSKFDVGANRNVRIDVEANTPRANISSLGFARMRFVFRVVDRDRQPQGKATGRPLFWRAAACGFIRQSIVRMAFWQPPCQACFQSLGEALVVVLI